MLVLICGLPNAGKTTFSSQFDNVIHFDDCEGIRDLQFSNCNRFALNVDGDVCIEGVYNSVKRRKELLQALKDKHDKCVCIWIDTSVDECLKREMNYRKRSLGIVHAHARSFEPPTLDEGWDEIIVIKPKGEIL